ncbi:MAG: hypothetical protein NC434_02850 [Ruminococcus sp.]|nr:hypothetical protein [Ruminococcus sp.]
MQEKTFYKNISALFAKQWFRILVLFMIGLAVYLVPGQEWVVIEKDSLFYLHPTMQNSGVMPLYPLFLWMARCIFGEGLYIDAVVVIQSLAAIFCTMAFVLYLQRIFRLRFIETLFCYLCTMLPFSIELPRVWITHQIMTESIAYALIYIYFIFILQYVFKQQRKWLLAAVLLAVFMGLIRSQLVFLLIVTAVFFICVEFVRMKKIKSGKKAALWGRMVINLCAGVIGAGVLLIFIYQMRACYLAYALPVISDTGQEAADAPEEAADAQTEDAVQAEQQTEDTAQAAQDASMSQMTHLIVIRGFYEADEEDVELFDTPQMQEIFRRVYASTDELQYRYVYARQDLYIWQDLVKDEIAGVAYGEVAAYLQENPDVSLNTAQAVRELGMRVLGKHFGRYLYHTIRLMISGFISSVFFQIERIYLLCHMVTLFLFAITMAGVIYCMRKREDKKAAVFALVTIGFIVMMVGIINLVFIGLQRYMVYAMGIFYCSLYLLLKEWGLPWIKKILKF